MSLSSALFSGISGLSTLGNSMTVIGDNIANVNTVGFKGSRVTFQDVLSQTVATTAGSAQVGRGTSMADISSSFAQGSFESTDSTTDLAIGGEGFFVVRDPSNEENEFYTRAGEFRFDKDGNFTNPAGYIVRGWSLDADTGEDRGAVTDVVLQSFTSSPKKTDNITAITNLDADANSKAIILAGEWDGTDSTGAYIGENYYEYQTALKVFDSLGSTHDITIYYDKGSTASTYEFLATCNPDEDKRTGLTATDPRLGVLGKGILTFNEASGAIESVQFWQLKIDNTDTDIGDPVELQYNPATPVTSGTYAGSVTRTYNLTESLDGRIGGPAVGTAIVTKYGPTTPTGSFVTAGYTGTSTLTYTFTESIEGTIGSGAAMNWTDGTNTGSVVLAHQPIPSEDAVTGYTGGDATYQFVVSTGGEINAAGTGAKITWMEGNNNNIGSPLGCNGTSQTVANGLKVDFGEIGQYLNAGDTFYVTCTAAGGVNTTPSVPKYSTSQAIGDYGLLVDFGTDGETLNDADTFKITCYTQAELDWTDGTTTGTLAIGTTPKPSGTYTDTTNPRTYTFTTNTAGAGAIGSGAAMDWTDGGVGGTITVDGTSQAVGALGLDVDFGEVGQYLNSNDNFTITCTPPTTTVNVAVYNPTNPTVSGTGYTATGTRTYVFTVAQVGAIDGVTAQMDWYDSDGGSGVGLALTGAPQAVGADLQVDFGVALEVLNDGDSFTITCTGSSIGDPVVSQYGEALTVGNYGLRVDCGQHGEILNPDDRFYVKCYIANEPGNRNSYTVQDVTTDLSNGYYTFNADFLGGTNTDMDVELDFGCTYNSSSASWVPGSLATTHYSAASTTTFQSANGYGAGDLQSVNVGTDGAITGQYSNGQVLPLYRVALAKFQNVQGLYKVGGNLFRETRLSGDPTTSKPGTNGLGSISPNSLEQSNVDIATEFVKMITTQRGFQANSKIITVTDQMLAELINLKR